MEKHVGKVLGGRAKTYVAQGLQSLRARQALLDSLFVHKKMPPTGWDDETIEYLLMECSKMDSNNFEGNVGVGEREGRLFSSIVRRRNYSLSHGIGRSGDIVEIQPKAAGSSIIYSLTNSMALHALHIAGLTCMKNCVVLPLATGMSLSMVFLTLKKQNPNGKYVIWSRIDQKSCFKSIITAGLTPLIVDPLLETAVVGDKTVYNLVTNSVAIDDLCKQYQHEILCVFSTTSCFAPRQPDRVDEIGKLCKELNIPHIINNAYGLQCPTITRLINRAHAIGRVDAVVQSTDKNFMVPVGGAIVSSCNDLFMKELTGLYPGRANANPILDLFITLLSMGEAGYRELLSYRNEQLVPIFTTCINSFLTLSSEAILSAPRNTISYAISLSSASASSTSNDLPFFGSMLFQRNISGCRVINNVNKTTAINGYNFVNWGSHYPAYPSSYFTVAVTIGMTQDDIATFVTMLNKTYQKYKRKIARDVPSAVQDEGEVDDNVI